MAKKKTVKSTVHPVNYTTIFLLLIVIIASFAAGFFVARLKYKFEVSDASNTIMLKDNMIRMMQEKMNVTPGVSPSLNQ